MFQSICSSDCGYMYMTNWPSLNLIPFVLDFEAIVKLSDGFNGADLRNVCTEAGEALNILVLCPQWPSLVLIFLQCSRRSICHSLWPGVCHPGRLHESCAQGGRFKEAGVQAGLQACINALLPLIYIVSPGIFSSLVKKLKTVSLSEVSSWGWHCT